MQELEKMQQADYRDAVFARVFSTDEGKLVLAYLDEIFRIGNPDFTNPSVVYYQLGKQSVITHIKNILKYGNK